MAKAKKNPKKHNKIHKAYDLSGGFKRKNKFCPKCGAGVFMAQHKNRATCGKCGYSEMANKGPAESKDKKK